METIKKEFKGTEGPWEFKRTGKGHFLISGIGWEDFAKVYTITDGGDFDGKLADEAKANAKLIAAAPDLLEACMEFVRKVECGEAKSKRSYAQMKQAIEKAL